MTVNTSAPNFVRTPPTSLSGQRLYLREEELDAGLAMIFDASQAVKAATGDVRARYSLNWTSARALTTLLRTPQGVQDLSVSLGMTKQAAIKTVEELEARALVSRVSHPRDGRRRTVCLTQSGAEIARDVGAAMRSVLAAAYRQAGGDAVAGCDLVLGALKKAKVS